MKVFLNSLSLIALILAIYNASIIDLETPFKGESVIAIITILAALCAILLLQILRISKKIEKQIKQK